MKRDYNNTDWNLIDSNFIIHLQKINTLLDCITKFDEVIITNDTSFTN